MFGIELGWWFGYSLWSFDVLGGTPVSYTHLATVGAAWAMLGKAYMAAPEETGLRDFAKADECLSLIHIYCSVCILTGCQDMPTFDHA